MATQTPVERYRAGSVSCALWENEINAGGARKKILKATVNARYKDKSGEWQSSQSFSRNEIPLAIYCLQKAFSKMVESPPDQDDGDQSNSVEEIFV